ncbi:MAG TPA: tol-pal system protein YbgF [Thermodesulfobacteriota bacterium]
MRTAILAVAAFGLVVAGCQSFPGDQNRQLQSDIQRLDLQVRQLRQAGGAGGELSRRLDAVERNVQQLGQQLTQLQRLQADLTARYDAIRQDQMTLTGRFDETKYLAQRLSQDQEQVQKVSAQLAAMDQRLRQLDQELDALRRAEGERQTTARTQPSPAVQAPSQASARAPAVQPAEALYQEGFELFKKREYAKAREKFQQFLKANPSSDFAEGAMYFIAETYFAERDYENAILRYEELLVRYPKGRRVPAALLQQGFAFKELGAPKDARMAFQKILDTFPNSTEATLAKVELPKLPVQ